MKELICIGCPKGCRLKVDEDNGFAVTGNGCPRGAEYGRSEVSNPCRVVTSTVIIEGAAYRRCPVRTDKPVPKSIMFDVMNVIAGIRAVSPVKRGEVLVENILGTDANLIVTRSM